MLIFHFPLPIDRPGLSGSVVRPKEMLEAFRELTDVHVVAGTSRDRADAWEKALSRGHVIGVYSELSTMPIALTDPDHLPRAPFLDYRYFRKMRAKGISVAAFYRDVHWRFPWYGKGLSRIKAAVAHAAYRLEWVQLSKSLSHLFVPSLQMLEHLPKMAGVEVKALPPGGRIRQRASRAPFHPPRFLYVGGITGHYDVAPLVRSAQAAGVHLTLCCRDFEWHSEKPYLPNLSGLSIVHRFGDALEHLYHDADVFLMWWPANIYMQFAMPVKVGEAIGWGLPIIANANTEAGQMIQREGLGWAVPTEEDLIALLMKLRGNPSLVRDATERVLAARERHSWKARARHVLDVLSRLPPE